MGAGIAQVAAVCGCSVRLIDVNSEILDRAMTGIRERFERSVDKGRKSAEECKQAMGRVTASSKIADLADIELAIEAVVENPAVKGEVFQQLERVASTDAVFATNTSSLRVSDIALTTRDAGRVVGMHFFNPAPIMPLVEIIAGRDSREEALTRATEAARAWGKTPVRVKDSPGFIVNRVARGFYLEALRLFDEGVADIAAIDEAMRTLGRFRMGPFQLMDLVGLDVNYAVSTSVWEQFGKPARLKPHDVQCSLVEQGKLGRKTGSGFYRYESDPPVVNVDGEERLFCLSDDLSAVVESFVRGAMLCGPADYESVHARQRYAFARILTTVMNEAALTLQEAVASAEDIDTAMKLGTNYPEGPLTWAGRVGHSTVGRLLHCMNEETADGRFSPAAVFAMPPSA